MKCPKCASILPDESEFCTLCDWSEFKQDPFMQKPTDTNESPGLAPPKQTSGIFELFDWKFTKLLSPRWIMFGYKLTVIYHAIVTIVIIGFALDFLLTEPWKVKLTSLAGFAFAGFYFYLSVIIARWFAEAALIFFKIHDELIGIGKNTGSK